MRILVDMDAVIASWGDEFDRCLDGYGEVAANIPRTAFQEQWNLNAGRTGEEREIIRQIMEKPGFYRELKPIAGAKEALKAAVAAGHDVRIVSSLFISNPTCASDKFDWLVRHFGQSWAQRLVLTTDKTVVHGDLLIDDKPVITGSMEPSWEHIVFGDYAYNGDASAPRLCEWDGFSIWLELILPSILRSKEYVV